MGVRPPLCSGTVRSLFPRAGARDPDVCKYPASRKTRFVSLCEEFFLRQNPPCPRRILSQAEALRALGAVNQTRFRRLARLGLLRRAPGGFDIDELREDHALAGELERRVAAIGEDRLTAAERNGAFAWLVEVARATPSNEALPERILELLERITPRTSGESVRTYLNGEAAMIAQTHSVACSPLPGRGYHCSSGPANREENMVDGRMTQYS